MAERSGAHDLETEDASGYKVPEKVDIKTLASKDADDESLRRWKAQLLAGTDLAKVGGAKRVVISELRVICENRPKGDIVYKLTPETLNTMKENPFILKESSNYKIAIQFVVEGDILMGLKHINCVYKKGIRIFKDTEMVGSFGPRAEPYSISFPHQGWEQAPSGILGRGNYTAKSRYCDDDDTTYLEFEYGFEIRKEWE